VRFTGLKSFKSNISQDICDPVRLGRFTRDMACGGIASLSCSAKDGKPSFAVPLLRKTASRHPRSPFRVLYFMAYAYARFHSRRFLSSRLTQEVVASACVVCLSILVAWTGGRPAGTMEHLTLIAPAPWNRIASYSWVHSNGVL